MIDANETGADASERRTEPHRVRYDPETTAGVSETLVLALADIDETDPLRMEPLHETVDPDTLEEFVESGGLPDVEGRVSFTFEGYDVTVHASGLLEIEPAD